MSPPSAREAALLALHQRLQAVPDATVLRNEVLPAKIPAGGLVIVRDGDPGEPEVTLNPVSYLWQHRAELEVLVEAATPAERDTALDALLVAIGEALASDPTLGGVVETSQRWSPDERSGHAQDRPWPRLSYTTPGDTIPLEESGMMLGD